MDGKLKEIEVIIKEEMYLDMEEEEEHIKEEELNAYSCISEGSPINNMETGDSQQTTSKFTNDGSLDSQGLIYLGKAGSEVEPDNFLIEMIRSYRIIYDKKSKGHFKAEEVENAWETISLITKRTVPEIKGRWRSLRDSYVVRKKKIDAIAQSGGSPSHLKEWEYFKKLQFLDGFISHRKKTTNTNLTRNEVRAQSNSSISSDDNILLGFKDNSIKETQRETPYLLPSNSRTTTPLLSDTDQIPPVPYIQKANFKKRCFDETITSALVHVADAVTKNCQLKVEDADLMFGHSIGLSLSKAKNKKLKSKIKVRIIELIAKLEEEN